MLSNYIKIIIICLFTNNIFGQSYISIESGSKTNSEVLQEWQTAGSSTYLDQRSPDLIFDAILDVGLVNDGLTDCSVQLQYFLDNVIDHDLNSFYGNKVILIYFPAGDYAFDYSITLTSRSDIIFKGDSYLTNFLFDTEYSDFSILDCQRIGFEDIYIERVNSNGYNTQSYTFLFYQVSDSWLSGIKSNHTYCAHLRLQESFNVTVTGCFFETAWVFGGGGQGYGVSLVDGTHHCLVENNIFSGLRHAILFQGDSKFNVIGYNSIYQNGYTLTDIEFHGKVGSAYGPSYNLIEGNSFELAQFSLSDDHGENGPFNTFLRNKSEVIDGNGMDLPHNDCSTSDQWGQNFILSNPNSHWANVWVCDHITNWQEDMDDLVNCMERLKIVQIILTMYIPII